MWLLGAEGSLCAIVSKKQKLSVLHSKVLNFSNNGSKLRSGPFPSRATDGTFSAALRDPKRGPSYVIP